MKPTLPDLVRTNGFSWRETGTLGPHSTHHPQTGSPPWGGRVAAAPRVGGKRDAVCNSPNAADAGRRAARRGTDV